MIFSVPIELARRQFPEFEFVRALAPSAQKSAFHVRRDNMDYCLKIISPNQVLDRIQREVLAMESIAHKNVVKLIEYEYSTKSGSTRHYIVEEFIAGDDLSDHLVPGVVWEISKIAGVFSEICDGLGIIKEKGIVHRDLKPSNIRVRPSGSPVIIDFGLARVLEMASITATMHGAMIGTPYYFAPEQFRGTKRDIDHRTDLYALGVMMYEAAVGCHPSFEAPPQTMGDLADAVCSSRNYAENTKFKLLDARLQILICRLLEKERAKRPAGADMVGKALRVLGGI